MSLPKILIVDDRQYDRLLYQEFLGDTNYKFQELDNGEKILETIQDFKPDIILLDWQMPNVNGLDSLKKVKKNQVYKDIPIIIITGLEDENVLEEAFDYGSVDFLNKPVSQIELNSRVLNAIKLNQALQIVLKQKEELSNLNEIIVTQKNELEKSLVLKEKTLGEERVNFKDNIDTKSRKLMSLEIDTTKLINDIKNIKAQINDAHTLLKSENPESKVLRKLTMAIREIENLDLKDNSWNDFKEAFESIDQNFYIKLNKLNPKLTPLDLKHCGYIKLNLDNYEVSRILNVELKSLQMTRYRLKKKLKVTEDIALREFILTL